MSSSRSNNGSDDFLGDSWVEVGSKEGSGTPSSITQQLTVENYLRLLKEAQESNQSSCRVSQCSSRRESPRDSPKSPPNSPTIHGTPSSVVEWEAIYNLEKSREEISALDWCSRPDTSPPQPWSFGSPRSNDRFSLRYAKIGNTPLFSKRGLCIMFLTNLFSLILGTGVGIYLHRHVPAIKVR